MVKILTLGLVLVEEKRTWIKHTSISINVASREESTRAVPGCVPKDMRKN